jgi:cobalt-zinc-cadmium efflux system outer membrane protein
MKTSLFLTLFLALAISGRSAAPFATNRVASLTIEQALGLAERHNPDLMEAAALVRMENAPFNGRTTRDADYVAGVGFTVPLGGKRGKAVKVEELDRERLNREAEVRLLTAQGKVRAAFATALFQEQARQIRAELLTSAEQAFALARARVSAGDAVPSEVARVEAELATARMELQRSEGMRTQSLVALSATIGLRAELVESVFGSLRTAFDLPALEELSSKLAAHPALSAAEADVSARDAEILSARAARIPDLKAELLYRRIESTRQDAFDVGVSLPLPFFDNGRGRVAEAEGRRDAAEARARSTRAELEVRLRDAHTRLAAALAESRTVEADVLPRLETVAKSTEARYAAGDLGLGEVLPVRRDHAEARLRHLDALREGMLALAEIRTLGY